MVKIQTVKEELDFLTDRISSQVRAIALGLIAITWGLLIGDVKLNIAISEGQRWGLLWICAIAIVVMFFDFLQYAVGFFYTNSLRKKMLEANKNELKKDEKDWRWKARYFLFYIKQFILGIGVLWLIGIMITILV